MSKKLTASDRKLLLKRAASLPVGNEQRRAILAGLKTVKTARGPHIEDEKGVCVKWAPPLFNVYVVTVYRNSLASDAGYVIASGKPLSWVLAWGKAYDSATLAQDVNKLKSLKIKDTWSAYDSVEEWAEDGGGMEMPVAVRADDPDGQRWTLDFGAGWVAEEDWG